MDVAVQTRWHPAACIFPMLPDSELQELANDIRKHGLRDPIILFQGLVLDGRNRWAACETAGVKPKTRDLTGSPQDALSFVWSSNVHRRHLNSSQAAIALAKREILDTQYRKVVEAAREMAAKNQHDKAKSAVTNNCHSKKERSMTFDELILCIAVENAGRCPDTPRSQQQRVDLSRRVFPEWVALTGDSFFPFTIDNIVHWDTAIRKNKDTRTKVEVAREHGTHCFWRNRGKGPCSDDAECGHIWQNSRGGPMSVEDYIKSTLGT